MLSRREFLDVLAAAWELRRRGWLSGCYATDLRDLSLLMYARDMKVYAHVPSEGILAYRIAGGSDTLATAFAAELGEHRGHGLRGAGQGAAAIPAALLLAARLQRLHDHRPPRPLHLGHHGQSGRQPRHPDLLPRREGGRAPGGDASSGPHRIGAGPGGADLPWFAPSLRAGRQHLLEERLHIAGEHTDMVQGYMEGALASGRRAAVEIGQRATGRGDSVAFGSLDRHLRRLERIALAVVMGG